MNRVARKGSELFVQPAELARKLVKEMEDHKVSRPPHVSVRNRYTIFLCEEDWDRLGGREDQLADKLERHLAKHVRAKKYETAGDISVDLVCDPDLKLGHFGILAQKAAVGFSESAPGIADSPPGWDAGWDEPAGIPLLPVATGNELGAASAKSGPVRRLKPASVAEPKPLAVAEPKTPAAAKRGRFAGAEQESGSTKVIPPAEAADLGLARETIVIKSGNRVREFSHGRVVVGRAADADFRIDNPDVSRRHAALYWSNGKIVIEDLGSTNGTMVNGYPVSSTVIVPSDVIVIGDCKLTVQAR